MKAALNKIPVRGGILTPIELLRIIEMLQDIGLDYFHFGSRQDILFPSSNTFHTSENRYSIVKVLRFDDQKKIQNIVCSYVSADIFPTTPWLTGSTYLYILEQFSYDPSLKINISDPNQQLVPLFNGHLNFIASPHEDYWYLYLDIPSTKMKGYFPVLIFSWDVAKVSAYIEKYYDEHDSIESLYGEVINETETNSRTIEKELDIFAGPFPYYEGMNKMGLDRYWLGLYWRNNCYDLQFLKAMCNLCIECKIGKICITPWKSLIVKGIPTEVKVKWEKLLGLFGINVRHSSLELNWHLPVCDEEALQLKNYIVQTFDQNDISTYGLTFSVASGRSRYFTTIVIEKNTKNQQKDSFHFRPTYNVLYSKKFNPNNLEYLIYGQSVDQMELPTLLMELSRKYYQQLDEGYTEEEDQKIPSFHPNIYINAYQCSECQTIYDSSFGDLISGIAPNTPFEQLENYVCPVCSSPKESFVNIGAA